MSLPCQQRNHQPGAGAVDEFIQALPSKRAESIDDFVEECLNGQTPETPPPAFRLPSRSKASCASSGSVRGARKRRFLWH
jgi:hypothetical protein